MQQLRFAGESGGVAPKNIDRPRVKRASYRPVALLRVQKKAGQD